MAIKHLLFGVALCPVAASQRASNKSDRSNCRSAHNMAAAMPSTTSALREGRKVVATRYVRTRGSAAGAQSVPDNGRPLLDTTP